MRPFFYFFYSFSFVRSSKRWEKKKRRHKLNFVGCKEYIYMTSKSPKRPENFVTSPLSPILVLKS
jgi:hypothetical protein